MKTPLVAVLALFPLVVVAGEPTIAADFKFEMPPLKAADALKQAPLKWAEALKQTPLTISNANPIPAPPVPATLLAPRPPVRTRILVPKNVDPKMPIKEPDPSLDPRIFVQGPATKSGK